MSALPEEYKITVNGQVEHALNDEWVLWYHDFENSDWSLSGYEKILTIATVEDFWRVYNCLPTLVHGMWFLMRKGITPRWEDEINAEGGTFKFKVKHEEIDVNWLTLSMYLVGEQMCRAQNDAELISGISVSPKKHGYATLSVWNLDATKIGTAIFPSNIPGIDFTVSRYEAHSNRRDFRKSGGGGGRRDYHKRG